MYMYVYIKTHAHTHTHMVCVCVRSGRIPCHQNFFLLQGARAALKGPAPTQTPFFAGEIQRDAVGRTCNCDVCECPFGPLPEPPLLLCAPVKVATGKPSVLRAETYRTRDLSVVLETHQLYSRLISCTRMISTLPWELKCDHPILGEPRVYPSCDPGPVRRKILTSTFLSQLSGISRLSRNEVSLKGRQPSDHS